MKTPEPGVFIVSFEHIPNLFVVLLLFTFEQVNVNLDRNHSVDLQLICIPNQFTCPSMSETLGLNRLIFKNYCVQRKLTMKALEQLIKIGQVYQ